MPSVHVYSAGHGPALSHFQKTVLSGLQLADVMPFIADGDIRQSLETAFADGTCFLWGDRGGGHGRMYWNLIETGDLALCYSNKQIIAASSVVAKLVNRELALFAWPDMADKPYECVFFLSKPILLQVPVASLPQYFGKVYQGLRRLPTSEAILREYGSLDAFLRRALIGELYPAAHDAATPADETYFPSDEDTRRTVDRSIRLRRGQPQFRENLFKRYGSRCMVTGCCTADVLEAAHIRPYRGENDNNPENGLLLRSDIHTLFDLDLLGINPATLQVIIHRSIANGEYGDLDKRPLFCKEVQPSRAALDQRWNDFIGRD